MASDGANPLTRSAIRVAAAGLGAAVAGPLGCALGAVIGDALGEPATKLLGTYFEKFGEEAAKKFFETGADSLVEKFKKSAPDLEFIYRQALRLSLSSVHAEAGSEFDDWFSNWDLCLKTTGPLNLGEIQPDQLTVAHLDTLFRRTMERLDAQGTAIRQQSMSLVLRTRPVSDPLLTLLTSCLSERFKGSFQTLIVQPEYERAWKEAELIFRDSASATLGHIDQRTESIDLKTDALPRIEEKIDVLGRTIGEGFQRNYEDALKRGVIAELKAEALEAEKTRLAEELRKLQAQLATRTSEPTEVRLAELLESGDFDGALLLKSQQVTSRREEAHKLPRELYELGIIYDLRFDWPRAFAAYREAWELCPKPDYGFQYAVFAQRLNYFNEAIAAYETLLRIYTEPSDRATTLNNLAILYRDTQRIDQAEQAFGDALVIRRKLAEGNPDVLLPSVATTLNNLAILFSETERLGEAERAFDEALAILQTLALKNPEAYWHEMAITLINIAGLYHKTQRPQMAGQAYTMALTILGKLANKNPSAYMPNVARALNNLAAVYLNAQRSGKAEHALGEALTVYRELAQGNPDTYLPDVAMTLNNLAILYRDTQRPELAAQTYDEALDIFRKLAESNPDAFLPRVAVALNNVATLEHTDGRTQDAEAHAAEAERILGPLWQVNPDLHGNRMASILATRAVIAEMSQRPATACAFIRRAHAAAYDLALKQRIQVDFDRLCAKSEN